MKVDGLVEESAKSLVMHWHAYRAWNNQRINQRINQQITQRITQRINQREDERSASASASTSASASSASPRGLSQSVPRFSGDARVVRALIDGVVAFERVKDYERAVELLQFILFDEHKSQCTRSHFGHLCNR